MANPGSPFGKKTSMQEILPPASGTVSPVSSGLVTRSSLTPATVPTRTATAISKEDVDTLGSELQVQMGRTSNKIIDSMTTSKFGDLGDIIVQVQNTAEKLDPAKQFGGITGWFRSKVVDIKSYLKKEFVAAGKVFDQLTADLTKHIAVHAEWDKNLDLIFNENFENYKNLDLLLTKATSWKDLLQKQYESLPPIAPDDPDAMMKAQDRADLQALINRVDMKLDTFRRLKQIAENNAPKIRAQQKTSQANQMVLRDIVDFTIPVIRQEFALYLNSLDSQKTQQLIQNTRVFAQQTMVKSADAASTAAISAAKNLNAPMLDNPTLDHLREKILFTISEVKRVEGEAATQRQQDAVTMKQSTESFVKQLSSS